MNYLTAIEEVGDSNRAIGIVKEECDLKVQRRIRFLPHGLAEGGRRCESFFGPEVNPFWIWSIPEPGSNCESFTVYHDPVSGQTNSEPPGGVLVSICEVTPS